MIAKDETRTLVLRGIQAEVQKELIAKKSSATEGTDDEVLAVIKRLVKQRNLGRSSGERSTADAQRLEDCAVPIKAHTPLVR